ncbi:MULTISPECIES: ATP-grasp domain-containing protein [Micromonospora]|uniref:Biotin carboxylase n=1 Tax=Micromonospora yangpuensis TaxID=683228 RepID=A0A1C6V3N5_9ACTN|nr:ATP-grasp domain-containing protein [Micromonospora yangpuensis]GGM15160.1 carboxylase [Micromonospora yangpuensis]SCL60906.1 Biotin carboxylase [Micromonospora yangpuensis]
MSIVVVHKTNLSRRRHLERARRYATEHGEELVLLMTDASWETDFADRVVPVDVGDVDEVLAAVKAESAPVSGVVTFAEALVPAVARVAHEFDLSWVGERTAQLARDKFRMRQAAAAAGVAQPRFGLARTVAEALAVADHVGFPLVLKPVLGTGSMFVRSVADRTELTAHFDAFRAGAWAGFSKDPLRERSEREHDGALLLEEFVPGPEISVESLVVDGVTHPVAIHDKPLPTGPTFEEVYACTPTRLPAEVAEAAGRAAAEVHAALGITVGGSHVEFRLRDGVEPVLLEAAARLGGGPICRSVLLSTGVDLVAAALDLATGRTPVIAPRERPTAVGFWNIFPARPGRLVAAHGIDEARADERVAEIDIYRAPGDLLAVPPRTFQGHGHLIFVAPSVDDLDATFHELTRMVRLETEPA